MILYQLSCASGHEFEAWFRDGASYDLQHSAGAVECPFCGISEVSKVPMAPSLATGRDKDSSSPAEAAKNARVVAEQILQAVNSLREHVEKTCEDVGDQFPDEARRIHQGLADERGIYGTASEDDASDLAEEGVEFVRLPSSSRRSD